MGTPLRPCVAPASAGSDPVVLLGSPAMFDCVTRQSAFQPGDYWVRLDGPALHSTPAEPLVLQTQSVWMDRLTLHVLYADGSLVRQSMDSHGITRHIQLGALIEIPIPVRQSPVAGMLLHMEGAASVRGLAMAPKVVSRAEASQQSLWLAALYAGFVGLCIALLVYNFVLWVTLRHSFQLFYCAMILSILCYAFTSSGAASWSLPWLDNNDRLRANYLLLSLTAIGALMFMRDFFETRVVGPKIRSAIRWGVIFLGITSIALASLAPWQVKLLDRLYFMSFAAGLVIGVPLLISAWRHRSRYLALFLLAWSAPIVVTAMRAMHSIDLLPYSFWLDNGTIVAMAIESLLSSLVIAYRIRLLIEERDIERAERRVAERLANSDALTGLLNRRAFLAAAIGREGPQRLMLIDIDHFKRINDTIGHVGGDAVLKAFALALRKWAPEGSLVARMGGEEFGIIVEVDDPIPPAALLECIRAQAMPHQLKVTASIGVGEGPLTTDDEWIALYRSADASLYRAKAGGRDRICFADELEGIRITRPVAA